MEENLLLPLAKQVSKQAKLVDGYIDMYVNSYGGNAHVAQHVVELMELGKRNGVTVRTMVTGAAYSTGSMVAVVGTPGHRYISKDAFHLAHYGSIFAAVATPTQSDRNATLHKIWFRQTVNHYKRYCEIPNLEENLLDDDWYITAANAKKWSMADHYLDKFVM
jgi:ATP-dependent protease ClpP protease subunit